jgi:Phosphodiester glycosidase
VDRILLARVDPSRFRFVVHYRSTGHRELGDWMRELGAVLVINGSYFSTKGSPDTPIVSAGVSWGPQDYDAKHGASSRRNPPCTSTISPKKWRTALQSADDDMVSYPLFATEANRSFVGEEKTGLIVVGTTKEAYFSLEHLATSLRDAPLQLKMALNLDGGRLACQGIALNGFNRDFAAIGV